MTWHTNSNALPLSLSTKSFKKDYDNSTNEKFLFPLIEELKKEFELSTYVQYPEINEQNVGYVLFSFKVLPHMTTDIFHRNGKYFVNFKFWSFDGRIPLDIDGIYEFEHAKSFSLGYMLDVFDRFGEDGNETIEETVNLIRIFIDELTTAIDEGWATYDYGR